MIFETFNPELPRRTKCSQYMQLETNELDVPYDTFFPSAILVDATYSDGFQVAR